MIKIDQAISWSKADHIWSQMFQLIRSDPIRSWPDQLITVFSLSQRSVDHKITTGSQDHQMISGLWIWRSVRKAEWPPWKVFIMISIISMIMMIDHHHRMLLVVGSEAEEKLRKEFGEGEGSLREELRWPCCRRHNHHHQLHHLHHLHYYGRQIYIQTDDWRTEGLTQKDIQHCHYYPHYLSHDHQHHLSHHNYQEWEWTRVCCGVWSFTNVAAC